MECPKCKGNLEITHVYGGGESGSYKRGQCTSCSAIVTIHQVIINTDPPRGQGAFALAKKSLKG